MKSRQIQTKESGHAFQTVTYAAEFKALTDTGEFSGYASIFGNVDLGGDIVERHAFQEMEKTRDGKVRILYNHNTTLPIGSAIVKEDDAGLHFDGKLVLEDPTARKCYAFMKTGILDGMSIGYDVLAGGAETTNAGVRKLKALKLWEISLVMFGMNPQARVESVKSADEFQTLREFEDYLRDVGGHSRAEAKTRAAAGWKARKDQRDAGTDVKQLTDFVRGYDVFEQRDAAAEMKRITDLVRSFQIP